MDFLRRHRQRLTVKRVVAVYMLYDEAFGPNRRFWVHDTLKDRDTKSEFLLAAEILERDDEDKCVQYLRMDKAQFKFLLALVEPDIKKQDTYWRQAISARDRLVLTLRYLATGASQIHLAFSFRLGHTTVGFILKNTLQAIWRKLLPITMTPPTERSWRNIARDFENYWHCPNCIGALDNKHIKIRAPPNSGSGFYNYKGFFSIHLMAICDANYKYILVDIGDNGRHSDGGVFSHSRIGKKFEECSLSIPPASVLRNTNVSVPFYFAADDAFPLKAGIVKPYSGRYLTESNRIFNYRLCRARRVVENTFGIMACRWRIFYGPIYCDVDLACLIVQGCVVLHNYLQADSSSTLRGDRMDQNGNIINGNWRDNQQPSLNLHPVNRYRANYTSLSARLHRDRLRDYFVTVGSVPWQWNK